MTVEYVCGFLFTHQRALVALIRKKHPEWMNGYLNGIGGKIDPTDESPAAAMSREFKEETGLLINASEWQYFAKLHHPSRNGIVKFFHADLPRGAIDILTQMTDEPVAWYTTHRLKEHRTMSNLQWLIPMALDKDQLFAEIWDRSNT